MNHILRVLNWVVFEFEFPIGCQATLLLLPGIHQQPKPSLACSGTAENQVNPTQVSEHMNHPVTMVSMVVFKLDYDDFDLVCFSLLLGQVEMGPR